MEKLFFKLLLNEETGRVELLIPCENVAQCPKGMISRLRQELVEEGIDLADVELKPYPATADHSQSQHLLAEEAQNA